MDFRKYIIKQVIPSLKEKILNDKYNQLELEFIIEKLTEQTKKPLAVLKGEKVQKAVIRTAQQGAKTEQALRGAQAKLQRFEQLEAGDKEFLEWLKKKIKSL